MPAISELNAVVALDQGAGGGLSGTFFFGLAFTAVPLIYRFRHKPFLWIKDDRAAKAFLTVGLIFTSLALLGSVIGVLRR